MLAYAVLELTCGVPSLEMTGTTWRAAYLASSLFIIIFSSCSRSFLLSPSGQNRNQTTEIKFPAMRRGINPCPAELFQLYFSYLKMELLTQFPASNDEVCSLYKCLLYLP